MEKVLRASRAGFPCDRNLWYSVNVESCGEPDERTQRIFDVGTCLEPLVVEWLRRDGWDVEYNAGSQTAPFEVNIPLNGGLLSGHPDCFITRGDVKNVLADIKTMNERSFREWRRNGTLKSKPQYADQVHIYARGCLEMGRPVDHLAIVGVNKNTSELHIDFMEYDESRIAEILSRSERIMTMRDAPRTGSPRESWSCRYCEYREMCELHVPAAKPKPEACVEYTEDEGVIRAMRLLKDARDMGKESRDRESEAKELLDKYVKESGKTAIQGGGLIFRMTERVSSRFDTALFKREHPELVCEYQKPSLSVMYEVKDGSEYEDA